MQNVSCKDCSLSSICLPMAVTKGELDQLESLMHRGRTIQRGEHLFRSGDPFHCVMALRTGAVKTYSLSSDGSEQVTSFYLPGELLGLGGIVDGTHCSCAVALETVSVCEIPFARLEELAQQIPSLQHHLFRLLSAETCAERQLHQILGRKSADERLAAFLVALSARHRRRGLSASRFRLPMSRYDIGNYLGMAVETVSRVFTRFQQQGLLQVDGREVTILDREGLSHDGRIEVQNA